MQLKDLSQRRRLLFRQLGLAVIGIGFLFVITDSLSNDEIPAEALPVALKAELPLSEVSGFALQSLDAGSSLLYAVGDRNAVITVSRLENEGAKVERVLDFSSLLLKEFSFCGLENSKKCKKMNRQLLGQWEALAVDGAERLFILKEFPPAILALEKDATAIASLVTLRFNEPKEHSNNNLGEGFILLKNGHFAVVKEKAPATLVEFGPNGASPLGINKDTILPQSEKFELSEPRLTYEALKSWELPNQKCDVSELTAAPDGSLFVLSQKCRQVTQIAGVSPSDNMAGAVRTWHVNVKNPEALVVRANPPQLIIGRDAQKIGKKNLYFISLPDAP